MKALKMFVAVVLGMPFSMALAQSAPPSSTLKMETPLENKKFKENTEITDSRLRAQAGSVSKYSLRFDLVYYGPALGKLEDKDQPNPDNVLKPTETALKGTIGGRYRLSSISSLSLSGGLNAIYPLHGMERVDLNTPTLTYDIFQRFDNLQMRNAVAGSVETVPGLRQVGATGALSYGSSLVYDLGTSGFSTGLDGLFLYRTYEREVRAGDRPAPSYVVVASPLFKYNVSDRLSFGTSTSFSFWNPRTHDNKWALLPQTVTQKLNMGYAFTKDVYLSPYLSTFPGKMTLDNTTLNIQTIFSLM